MKFVKVKEVPPAKSCRKKSEHNDFDECFERYMKMEAKYVRVEFSKNEYARAHSAMQCMRKAILRRGLPVEIKMRGGDIYLVRTDL